MSAPEQEQHVDVGAFVLGVLDPEDSARFEAHLGMCPRCAAEFDDLIGLEPILADFAASAPNAESLSVKPSSGMLDRLVGEISVTRKRRRRRGLYLVAAAAALIVGGPVAAAVVTASVSGGEKTVAVDLERPAKYFFDHVPAANKVSGTDPATAVNATIGVETKSWGTHVVLELGNVRGPLKCDLVAVGKNGEREVVTTWSVPKWGYGIKDSTNAMAREPLYMHGGTAMEPTAIDHFEISTLDGERRLIRMKAPDRIEHATSA
jgi:hypothetical protein